MSQKEKDQVERAMKSLRFQVKAADPDQGIIEAVFARFNVKDLDGDITMPGAFEDGAEVLISWYNHGTWGDRVPVGKGVIHADKEKAWVEAQLWLDTTAGAEMFKVIKYAGDLQEWSYGYKVLVRGEVTDEMYQLGIYRVLEKVKVFEVSPVLVGAGIGTETLSVKSAKDEPVALTEAERAAEIAAEIAAKATRDELAAKARKEFARFSMTRARLSTGRDAAA